MTQYFTELLWTSIGISHKFFKGIRHQKQFQNYLFLDNSKLSHSALTEHCRFRDFYKIIHQSENYERKNGNTRHIY